MNTVNVPREPTLEMLDAFLRCIPTDYAPTRHEKRAAYAAMLSAAPLHEGEGERDYPAEFEAWWADYRHKNREPADYQVKKQIGFDAFYFAARSAPPPSAPRMLVDQSWLARRVENEPDGLDCEVVPSAEVERLREALEPFAACADTYADFTPDEAFTDSTDGLTVGECRKARAALSRKQEPGVPTPGGEGK